MNEVWRIGRVKVTRVVEMEVTGGTRFILPDATREAVRDYRWLHPHFMDEKGNLVMSIHALVVDTGELRIVVDTCIGNDKQRAIPTWSNLQTSFLTDLETAGYPPSSIDTVLCTHLHVDHVGWNTMLLDGEWVPTFRQRPLPRGRGGVAVLARRRIQPGRARADSVKTRHGCRSSGLRTREPPPLRRGLARADAGTYAWTRQCSHRLGRRGGTHYRRLHSPSLPDDAHGLVQFGGLRPGPGSRDQGVAARTVCRLRRAGDRYALRHAHRRLRRASRERRLLVARGGCLTGRRPRGIRRRLQLHHPIVDLVTRPRQVESYQRHAQREHPKPDDGQYPRARHRSRRPRPIPIGGRTGHGRCPTSASRR